MKKIYHTSNCFKRFENYLKFSLVSLAILFTALPANATADGTKLTLSFKDSNLPAILKEIKNQTKYDFMYNSKEIDTNKKISMELKNVTLDSALKVCLTPFGLTYTIKDKIIILKKKTLDHITQVIQSMVNGIVKDKSGATLPGVAVVLKGCIQIGCRAQVRHLVGVAVFIVVNLVRAKHGLAESGDENQYHDDQKRPVDPLCASTLLFLHGRLPSAFAASDIFLLF